MIPAKCPSLHTLFLCIACHHLQKRNSQFFVLCQFIRKTWLFFVTNVGITDMIPAKYRPVALGGVLTGIWQCVAVCCSVLQCVAACGTAWQCCAVCCRLLRSLKTIVQWHWRRAGRCIDRYVAVCCSVLRCCSVCCSMLRCLDAIVQWHWMCCSVLQCVAVCCSVLQCVTIPWYYRPMALDECW